MSEVTELQQLKAKADKIGVKYHHAIGAVKLTDLIAKEMGEIKEESTAPKNIVVEKTPAQIRAETRKNASKLIRINITNMNPNKKAWQGEIYTVSNSVAGTFKKFIPFGYDYHIPAIMLPTLQEKEYRQETKSKDSKGRERTSYTMNKELAINILPSLTSQELEKLGKVQAMAKGES